MNSDYSGPVQALIGTHVYAVNCPFSWDLNLIQGFLDPPTPHTWYCRNRRNLGLYAVRVGGAGRCEEEESNQVPILTAASRPRPLVRTSRVWAPSTLAGS